jgi:hypothetical protein
MALKYTNPDNIPFSGWVVSGKEAEFILNALNEESQEASRCLFFSSENMERIKKVMAAKHER